ncbi:hypothetical protein K438DRAFT_1965088 [Mycena galopus ATCC 62051]|nr:hypothetical protein K438DRAFT_1965088 [Mycena galopus ATCC 62051]
MSGTRTRSPPAPGGNILQPRPGRVGGVTPAPDRGNGLFNDRGGIFSGQGGASYSESSFQQGTRRSETSYNSANEEANYVEIHQESRTRRRRFTLADCQLDLVVSTLTIAPASPDFEFESTTVNLDEFVGNLGGELVWGGGADNFSESCNSIRLEKTFLVALCSHGTNEFVEARLNLDDHIAYFAARHCFGPITPDPAFAELMASPNWMNFTVITQPDMRSFLRNKAFQEAISGVARRAIAEVMTQMKAQMEQAVEIAMRRVREESEELIQSEMDTLVKQATKTAAYSGLSQLRLMELEQRRAFNVFAPHIAAPRVHEQDSEFDRAY